MKIKSSIAIIIALAACAALLAGCAGGSSQGGGASTAEYIGEDAAKRIALEHAEVAEADATFARVKLDADASRAEYEVEFYAGGTEYDYEIDAVTGEIISYDYEAESYDPAAVTSQTAPVSSGEGAHISEGEAADIALAHAGFTETDVEALRVKLERDDGRDKYEVEFRKGAVEYSYDVDAASGEILEYEMDDD